MYKLSALSVLAAVVCCCVAAPLNDNIDIDIKVDTDSKLYHQGKTVEGSFNYGYNVPRRNYNQYQHKVKGPDGVTYGCYGFVDPTNGTHLYHYVSDLKGYRVVAPNKPTRVYSERLAESVANIYDAVGVEYDWEKLYFPDVCRVLQRSKEERNELSIPPGLFVNDDGSVVPKTTTERPRPTTPAPTTTRRPPPPPPTQPPPTRARFTERPTTPRRVQPTRPPTTPARALPPLTPPPTTQPPRTNPPTTQPPRTTPSTTRATPPPAPRTQPPPPPPRPTPPPTPARVRPPPTAPPTTPRAVPKRPDPAPAPPKTSGNKFGPIKDNVIGTSETNVIGSVLNKLEAPTGDLTAVGQSINEVRTLLQKLLASLGTSNRFSSPQNDGPDCDPGLGVVDPNAKHVFLPLVIVDSLPGAPRAGPGGAGGAPGVPAGSQFALPAVGYGASRCNTCG